MTILPRMEAEHNREFPYSSALVVFDCYRIRLYNVRAMDDDLLRALSFGCPHRAALAGARGAVLAVLMEERR